MAVRGFIKQYADGVFNRATMAPSPVRLSLAALVTLAAFACSTSTSWADEGGLAFWLAGEFGSLAAVQQVPGWAIAFIDLYNPVSGGGNVAAARQVTINGFKGAVNQPERHSKGQSKFGAR
jgi:hypothetical protein